MSEVRRKPKAKIKLLKPSETALYTLTTEDGTVTIYSKTTITCERALWMLEIAKQKLLSNDTLCFSNNE